MQPNRLMGAFARYVCANVLGMVGISCYILADTFYIARGLGPDALAALNLALPLFSLVQGIGLMAGMGGATRYTIALSSHDRRSADAAFCHALCIILPFALVFLCLGLFGAVPLSRLLGADASTVSMTSDYLGILLTAAPLFLMNNLMLCFLRNDGAPKQAMAAMLIGSGSNILLDYIFIYPLGMGMAGAALATAIAPAISLLVMLPHLLGGKSQIRLRWSVPRILNLCDLASLGAPFLVFELSSGAILLTFNVLFLHLSGNLGVAAYGVVANIALVVTAIFTGIAQGVQPLLSDCYGKGEQLQTARLYRAALFVAFCFAVAVYGGALLFSDSIVAIFNRENDPLLAAAAKEGILIYFLSFLFAALNTITAACCSAVSRAREGFLLSLLRGVLLMVPLAFCLAALFGERGVWVSVPLAEAVVSLLIVSRILPRGGLVPSAPK